MSDSSNSGHPFAFRDSSDNSYTTGVTTSGTAGSSGATVVIVVAANAPSSLKYYCTSHGNAMGNTINVIDDNVGAVAGALTNVNIVGGAITNVNNVGNSISNVNTVASNISSVNSFFNTYRIGSSNPTSSLDVGDLFFNTTSNSLKVYTGSAWVDGVTATGNFAVVTGNTFTGSNNHNDNVKSIYGTGSDLEIYHNGSHSFISDQGTGRLKLLTSFFNVQNDADNETIIQGISNGQVELYYDNSKKLETTSGGVDVTGTVSSDDFQIAGTLFHEGDTDTKLEFGNNQMLLKTGNATRLELNNSAIMVRSGFALGFSSTSGNSPNIKSGNTNNQHLLFTVDNTERFEVNNTGVDVTGALTVNGSPINTDLVSDTSPQLGGTLDTNGNNIQFGDSEIAQFGNSQEFQMWHDGTNSHIKNATGAGIFQLRTDNFRIVDAAIQHTYLTAVQDGAVELYYDNNKKFATKSDGIDVTGEVQCDSLDVDGVAHFQGGDVDIVGANYNLVWDYSESALEFKDNAKAIFGSGDDLQIYHSGSHSYIQDEGTGSLYIDANQLYLRNADTDNVLIYTTSGGEVRIQHNGNDRIRTDSSGVAITGDLLPEATDTRDLGSNSKKWSELHLKHYLYMPDDGRIRLGGNYDMQLWHDGSHQILLGKTGNTYVTCPSGQSVRLNKSSADNYNAEQMVTAYTDGAVELYYDNSKKFETVSDGNKAHGHYFADDGNKIRLGTSQDLEIYHNGTDSIIDNGTNNLEIVTQNSMLFKTADAESAIICNKHGSVDLYYDNVKTFATDGNGIFVLGQEGGTANIYIYADEGDDNSDKFQLTAYNGGPFIIANRASGGVETNIECNGNGNVELYYDNSKKLETVSAGVTSYGNLEVNGSCYPGSNNTYNLGTSSYRWANVYTNDLHLSNEGHSNDVDGTWGNWTIQEGESDLFLKNNRSGKKYKFNLTEVS